MREQKENNSYLGHTSDISSLTQEAADKLEMEEGQGAPNFDQKNTSPDKDAKGHSSKSTRSGIPSKRRSSRNSGTDSQSQQQILIRKKSLKPQPGRENLKKYLISPSDRVVRPIIGNLDIEALESFDYDPTVKDLTLVSNEELSKYSKKKFEDYMTKIYQTTVSEKITNKDKLHILHYFVNFIQNSDNANMIIESYFMDLFMKMLKSAKTKAFKIVLCTIVGLLLRHTTNINNDIATQGIPGLMINLTRDKSNRVRRRAIAALGEYLFFGATQIDGEKENEIWDIPMTNVEVLLQNIKSSDDEIIRFYAMKTIENITSQSSIGGLKFCSGQCLDQFIKIYKTAKSSQMRSSAIVCIVNISFLSPGYISDVIKNLEMKTIISTIQDSTERIQQALITLINLYLYYYDEEAVREVQNHLRQLYPVISSFFEHRKNTFRGKSFLLLLLMINVDFNVLSSIPTKKFVKSLDRIISQERRAEKKSRYIKYVIKEYANVFKKQLMGMFEFVETELPSILTSSSSSSSQKKKFRAGVTDDVDDVNNQEMNENVDFIDTFLTFLAMTLESLFIQNCIIDKDSISRFFKLLSYVDFCSKSSVQAFQDISGTILTIIENLVSNKPILVINAEGVVKEVLPYICGELSE